MASGNYFDLGRFFECVSHTIAVSSAPTSPINSRSQLRSCLRGRMGAT
jgi:hypothetical protein